MNRTLYLKKPSRSSTGGTPRSSRISEHPSSVYPNSSFSGYVGAPSGSMWSRTIGPPSVISLGWDASW